MTDTYRIRSPETWAQAREAYAAGQTAETVCARFDLGVSTFKARAKDEGWRRSDQPDPEPIPGDLDDLPELDDAALIALARKRMSAAVQRGLIGEALRWGRMREMIRRHAEREATADARASAQDLRAVTASANAITAQARTAMATLRTGAAPASEPDNPDNLDSVLTNAVSSALDARLTRAQRRRLDAQTRSKAPKRR